MTDTFVIVISFPSVTVLICKLSFTYGTHTYGLKQCLVHLAEIQLITMTQPNFEFCTDLSVSEVLVDIRSSCYAVVRTLSY